MHFVSLFYPKTEKQEAFYTYPVLFPSLDVEGIKKFYREHMSGHGDEVEPFITEAVSRGVEIHNIALFDMKNINNPVLCGTPIKICNLADVFGESEVVSNVDTESV